MQHQYRLVAFAYLSSLLLLTSQFLSHPRPISGAWVLPIIPDAATGIAALALLTIALYPSTPKHGSGHGIEAPASRPNITEPKTAGVLTETKSAEMESERMSQVFEKSLDAILILDTEGKIIDANPAALRLIDTTDKSDLVGRNAVDFMVPPEQARGRNGFRKAIDGGSVRDQRYDFVTKHGARVPVEGNVIVMTGQGGEVIGLVGIARDISERLQMERNLEERTQGLAESVKELTCLNQASRIMASRNTARDDVLQQIVELVASSFQDAGIACARITCEGAVLTSPGFAETEWGISSDIRVCDEPVGVIQVYYTGRTTEGVEADNGPPLERARELFDTLAREVGQFIERNNSENALQKSEESYRALVESASDWIYLVGKDLTILSMNKAAASPFGRPPEQLVGKSLFDLFPKGAAEGYAKNIETVFASGQTYSKEELLIAGDHQIWTSASFNPVRGPAGDVVAVLGVTRDITSRKTAEEMLQRSQLELAIRNRIANVFLTRTDEGIYAEVLAIVLEALESKHGVFGYVNDDGDLVCPSITADVWGRCEMPGRSTVFRRQEWEGIWGRALLEKKASWSNSALKMPPGHLAINRAAAAPIVFQGRAIGLFMVGNRETDHDRASIRLLETLADKVAPILSARIEGDREERRRRVLQEEKEALHAQLLQSQKVESLGMLAAGMAHDFNNVLSSILGYSDIALLKAGPETPLHKELRQIKDAAVRGAGLTRQLLLFARRHPTEISPLDMSQLISDISEMLDHLVGDDVRLDARVDGGLWMIRGDRTGIEQVITNVVANARDAMPDGGRISLTAENVIIHPEDCELLPQAKPGKYVKISVTDDGIGMDEATIKRIFEPFFTTKEMGRGTGLGLSVTYSIVKQHGGWIDVESTPGAGSTLRLYFAAVGETAGEGEVSRRGPGLEDLKGKGERILVVDDEGTIRGLVARILTENGYRTSEAGGVAEALEKSGGEAGRFDLVLTDVVLLDGNGVGLADNLLVREPDLRVLLTSGYTDERLTWATICERGYHFLQKPFLAADLLRAVRTALQSEAEVTRSKQEMTATEGAHRR